MRHYKFPILISVAVLVFAALPMTTNAQNSAVSKTAIASPAYISGGIGDTELADMRRDASKYTLHVTFSAAANGEFLTDVPVVITDASGNQVFKLDKAGPLLYVMLPGGKYKVSAQFNGQTVSQAVTLAGKGSKDIYLRSNGKPKE